jgi:cell division septum initiation protein DivIVA
MIKEAVKKGEIRNTVLRQVKVLEKARRLLDQGRGIKEEEVDEYKSTNKPKVRKLQTQIKIISQGLRHLAEALKALDKYKDTSSTSKTAIFTPIIELEDEDHEATSNEPSIFKKTIYRLPTKKELEEIDSLNLSADKIFRGFCYTIVGRGMMGAEQKDMIIKAIQMLCDISPENTDYKRALGKAKEIKGRT